MPCLPQGSRSASDDEVRDRLILVAFLFAFGNTAFAMGAKDYGAAIFSASVAFVAIAVGILSSDWRK